MVLIGFQNVLADEDDEGPGNGRRPGRMDVGDGSVQGRFVRFSYDEAAGLVTSYVVGETRFFEAIRAPGPFALDAANGATLRLESGDGEDEDGDDIDLEFRMEATDNPNGLIRFRSEDGDSFRLTLRHDAVAVANGTRIDITVGGFSAFFTGGELSNGTIVVEDGMFMLRGQSVSAMATGYNPGQDKIDEAIGSGAVGARIEVLTEGLDVLTFDDIDVVGGKLDEEHYRFLVDANLSSGRTFVVDFAPGVLQSEKLAIRYYDVVLGDFVEVALTDADSIEDVLAIVEGEGPEVYVTEGLDGHQVLVAVPSFSIHAFEILSPAAAVLIVYGVVGGLLFGVMAALFLLFGRRRTT